MRSLIPLYVQMSNDPLVGGLAGFFGDNSHLLWFKAFLYLEAFVSPYYIIHRGRVEVLISFLVYSKYQSSSLDFTGCTKVHPYHTFSPSPSDASSRFQVNIRPPHNLRRLNSHHDTPMHPLLPSGSQSRFRSCHTRRRIINYRTTHPLVIELCSIFPYTPHNGGRHGVSRFGIGQRWYKGGEVGVTVIFYLYTQVHMLSRFYNFLHCSLFRLSHPKTHQKLEKVSWSCQ
jgi:hypothetical protein